MSVLLFITHPDVVIDPAVPVPDWPLSETGRSRMSAFAKCSLVAGATSVFCSDEQKAKDGADILAAELALERTVVHDLHENDRSSTGFLPEAEFWPVVEQFFAKPEESVQGWERSIDAQARIVAAVEGIRTREKSHGHIAIIAHGGVGALLLAHLTGSKISREFEQPHGKGGCFLTIDRSSGELIHSWRVIDRPEAAQLLS